MSSTLSKSKVSSEQLQSIQPEFDDELWNNTFHFMRNYSQPEEASVLPDEFYNFFPNSYSYHQVEPENFKQFYWVLLHKGRLPDLTLQFLNYICSSLKPVFANEVFVLFSRSQTVPQIHYKHLHLRSLLADIRWLKIQEILDHSRHQGKVLALIEQKNSYAHWFTVKQISAVVPLSWVSTSSQHPFANLGNALSPVIVSALVYRSSIVILSSASTD